MDPFWQVVVGELIGIFVMAIALLLCSKTGSLNFMSAIIFGAIVLVGFTAIFLIGEMNLYFSSNILKNIFIVAFYEELICLASFFISLIITGIIVSDFNEKDFLIFYIIVVVIASCLIGEQVFYKEIVNALV